MAQNFKNYITRLTGTSAVDALGGATNSIDCLISVRMANVLTSTITVDTGHTVDILQRYGDHTATINLTNAGGGYNLDLDQIDNTSNRSYSLTGTCATTSGCAVTVTQN